MPTESPAARYASAARDGVLAYQWDPAAQRAVFPPRLVAPGSGSTDLEWRESAGRGTLYSITWIRPRDGDPYNVALVDLDEGFRIMSRVDAAPEEARIGRSFAVRFDDGIPVFELA